MKKSDALKRATEIHSIIEGINTLGSLRRNNINGIDITINTHLISYNIYTPVSTEEGKEKLMRALQLLKEVAIEEVAKMAGWTGR